MCLDRRDASNIAGGTRGTWVPTAASLATCVAHPAAAVSYFCCADPGAGTAGARSETLPSTENAADAADQRGNGQLGRARLTHRRRSTATAAGRPSSSMQAFYRWVPARN
jgi:hypothetical protein